MLESGLGEERLRGFRAPGQERKQELLFLPEVLGRLACEEGGEPARRQQANARVAVVGRPAKPPGLHESVVMVVRQRNQGRMALHARKASLAGMDDVRSLTALWPLRQRRHAVILCLDDPAGYEAARPSFAALNAELLVERTPGPLSRALGRPSVTVADRFGAIGLAAASAPVDAILRELEAFELACPECGPQAWGDPTR
jgi:hypothetical protein